MILVTGGTGYIGAHTVIELLSAGHPVLVLDDLSNSKRSALQRVAAITGQTPEFVQVDLRDRGAVQDVFARYPIRAVIHFAGKKAVGESVARPAWYYDHNVGGTAVLLDAMQQAGVRTLVFSSSATVYGDPASVPIREDFPLGATNPYGRSKLMIEQMLADVAASEPGWHIARLRYFNPVGAHPSGLIGEDPSGIPNNLMPFITQVAVGRRSALSVFGSDWPTVDGTGVRDYIHVVDLARGHLAALDYLASHPGVLTVNLGTGRGTSVLEMVRAFEAASGQRIPYTLVARRPGDIATCYADCSLAAELLGWRAEYDLARMCADTWRWQQQNPLGLPLDPAPAAEGPEDAGDHAALPMPRPARPCVIWLTGLSGAGKSTLAHRLQQRLQGRGCHTTLLDGDVLRTGLNRDLGFSAEDRQENVRRVGEVARLMTQAGLIVIVALISPFRRDRSLVRAMFEPGEFLEVHVDVSLAVAEQRDPKGLYRRARRGELREFTGISSPYEAPEAPELRLATAACSIEESVQALMRCLRERGILSPE